MKRWTAISIPALCALLGTTAAAQADRATAERLPGRVVDVIAAEFFFRAPDTIPAGLVTFRLTQAGDRLTDPAKVTAENLAPPTPDNDPTRAFHMLWVVRLEPGHTVSEWFRAAAAEEATPWAVDLGGPASAEPPLTSNATMVLEPGTYVLVCHVGSAREDRNRRHLLKGMFRSLTVLPAAAPAAELPRADVVAHITGSGQVRLEGEVHAGPQSIRIINEAAKSYEFNVQKVKEGRTAKEAISWRRTDGTTHPFESRGGLSDIPPGATRTTTILFENGSYVFHTIRSATTSVAVTVGGGPRR